MRTYSMTTLGLREKGQGCANFLNPGRVYPLHWFVKKILTGSDNKIVITSTCFSQKILPGTGFLRKVPVPDLQKTPFYKKVLLNHKSVKKSLNLFFSFSF